MKVDVCRLCNVGKLSEPKLKFPPTPLANEFTKDNTTPQDLFPLEVCICEDCGHYQLNEQVDPARMFRDYLFVAGTSPVNVEHFKKYAVDMIKKFNLNSGDSILDIASNDGTLLKHFKDLGMSVLGIDPARNLADEANKNDIPTIPEFFTEEYADIMLEQYGKFNLITANNVFAHIPNLSDFAKGEKKLLKSIGVFSFEVSYFADVCDKTLFDTVYHEHSSYHTISPLIKFFNNFDMEIFDVERIGTHGGSVRIFVCHKDDCSNTYYDDYNCAVRNTPGGPMSWCYIHNTYSSDLNISDKVSALQKNINLLGNVLREKLQEFKNQGKSIAIYGVPAKATTLMYALGIDENIIDFAVDDAPLKQGTFTPGKHIPVLPVSDIYEKSPGVLLVLAWNFAESIIKNHAKFNGTWIVPLPELKEV
jgi:hypothetical protein